MERTVWGAGTGLQRLLELAEDMRETSFVPYGPLGMSIAHVEKGRTELAWTPPETLLNRGGVVHGGFIATALDEVAGVAAISLSEPATPFLTMSLNVDYLRPLHSGQSYTVVGAVQQSGRIRALVHSTISDDVGRLCAQATVSLTPNRTLLRAAEAEA
ncbi:PaaI family thioesterase [Streptomyces sp. NPDC051940]|uniref:PaaI family thioesterase n=1 Tax=Streptomyces sp. NPDC051940 TaxID=3155675 RepID=UPI0034458ED5